MQDSLNQLSPVNRYYLQRLIKNLSQSGSLPWPGDESNRAMELQISRLDAKHLAELGYLLHLHQELNNQNHHFRDDLVQLEARIFSLIGVKGQPETLKSTALTLGNPLGEILIREKLINQQQLNDALAEQKLTNKRLGEILIKRRWLTFEQLDQLLWEQAKNRTK